MHNVRNTSNKSIEGLLRRNKRSVVLSVVMALTLTAGSLQNMTNASDNYKTMVVEIEEGAVDQPTLTRTINIPNLKDVRIEGVSSEGTAELEVTGTEVTIKATGGTPTRKVDNPSKRTEVVKENRTSSSDSFADTITIDSGGIQVNLSKKGASRVKSGSYTPADSKYVEGQTNSNYNSGGYSGALTRYLYSGSYTPADSKQAEANRSYSDEMKTECGVSPSKCKIPQTVSYNQGGYSGTLSIYSCPVGGGCTYLGTVTRPESDTRVYRYRGTVTRPAVDTRVWEQDYEGTKHIPGVDNYYSYEVTLKYLDNTRPHLSIDTREGTVYLNNAGVLNMVGVATDEDNQTITLTATIGGVEKKTTLQAPIQDKEWEMTWTGNELPEGTHTSIPFTITDGQDDFGEIFKGVIIVDKTNPVIEVNIKQ